MFGDVGGESTSKLTGDREKVFYEKSGTNSEVEKLYKVWVALDADVS